MPIINGIHVEESQSPVQLAEFRASSRLFLNPRFTDIVSVRAVIADKVNRALDFLPEDMGMMIFESYRPRSRQMQLWQGILAQLTREDPKLAGEELIERAENFVSNPHKFGSGHQAAAAIDVTLCTLDGIELEMGTAVQAFNALTEKDCAALSPDITKRRQILKTALQNVGLVNYPAEWWHYSYGDRLWAEITGRDFAFFAPMD